MTTREGTNEQAHMHAPEEYSPVPPMSCRTRTTAGFETLRTWPPPAIAVDTNFLVLTNRPWIDVMCFGVVADELAVPGYSGVPLSVN
jgi:hypothetical protein